MKTGWGGPAGLALTLVATSGLSAQSWKTLTSSRMVTNEEDVAVRVTYGVGDLSISAGEPESLYRAQLRFDENTATPVSEYEDGKLHVGISRLEDRRVDIKNWSSEGSLELTLSPAVPIDLDLEFGAVRAELDLSGLSLLGLQVKTGASESRVYIDTPNPLPMKRADFQVGAADFTVRGVGNLNAETVTVNAGVGSVTLDLKGAWPEEGRLDIEMGLGALELRIPRDLGVRLHRSTLLTSIDTGGMVRRGNAYYSVNWDGAERRLDIEVSAALGSVDIVWVR